MLSDIEYRKNLIAIVGACSVQMVKALEEMNKAMGPMRDAIEKLFQLDMRPNEKKRKDPPLEE